MPTSFHSAMSVQYSPEESSIMMTYTSETCCICEEEFYSESELATHLIRHTDEEPYKSFLNEVEQRPSASTPGRNRPASVKRNLSNRSASPEVWEIVSDDSDDENANKKAKSTSGFRLVKTPTKGPENTAATPPIEKTFKCTKCLQTFNNEKTLKEHEVSHEKTGPFVCHICNKGFKEKAQLRQHLHMHIADKSHECMVCHMKFVLKSQLIEHEETKHRAQASKNQKT